MTTRALPILLATTLLACLLAVSAPAGAAPGPTALPGAGGGDYVPTVLVTGANKGIGLELAKQYAAHGARVIATARNPAGASELRALAAANARITVEQLDVTDHAAVDALAAKYAASPIDILINNAGINGGMQNQMLGRMDYAVYEEVLKVNTIAPLKIAEAFLPSVVQGRDKRIIAISSSEGSIGMVSTPRLYFMRASKAALNMEMRNLAMQLKPKGVIVALVNPGMVDTEFMKGAPKKMLRPAPEAVRQVIGVIDRLTLADTGQFLSYDGTTLPW